MSKYTKLSGIREGNWEMKYDISMGVVGPWRVLYSPVEDDFALVRYIVGDDFDYLQYSNGVEISTYFYTEMKDYVIDLGEL